MNKLTWTALLCASAVLMGCGGGDQPNSSLPRPSTTTAESSEVTRARALGDTTSQEVRASSANEFPSDPTIKQLTANDLGVSGEISQVKSRPRYVLQGGMHRIVGFLVRNSDSPRDLIASIESATNRVFLVAIEDGWDLDVDTTGLASGTSIQYDLTVLSTSRQGRLRMHGEIKILETTRVETKIGNAGQRISVNSYSIDFSGHKVHGPVKALVTYANIPNAGTLMKVEFPNVEQAQYPRFTIAPVDRKSPRDDKSNAIRSRSNLTLLEELEASIPYGDPNSPDSLKEKWRSGLGYYINFGSHRYPEAPTKYAFTIDPAYELHSLVSQGRQIEEWAGFRPVLFVHGFAIHDIFDTIGYPYPYFAGGPGTWNGFPSLVQRFSDNAGRRFVPFEFRWNTDTSFIVQGRDLAYAIRTIYEMTGQKVIIVAHSFGGILSRSVLQHQVGADNEDVPSMVSSILTLGTPHSGIAKTASVMHGVALPAGQDSPLFKNCRQVSCHVAGFPSLSQSETKRLHISKDPGEETAALSFSRQLLPPINFAVGIGNLQYLSFGVLKYGIGDKLISHEGQRLYPNEAIGGFTQRKWEILEGSGAEILEQGLGLNRGVDIKPKKTASEADLYPGDPRARDYQHFVPPFWNKLTTGLEANIPPERDYLCDDPATCNHGSWRLFKEIVNRADPSAKAVAKLNDTGTTAHQCYGAGSNVLIECDSIEALLLSGTGKQDGMATSPFLFSEVFDLKGKSRPRTDCVLDNRTGLMWEGKPLDGGLRDATRTYTNLGNYSSSDSSTYVAAVNAVSLCGYSDWRLPKGDELQSIMNFGIGPPAPAIDTSWFPNSSSNYWTETSLASTPDYWAFYASFSLGGIGIAHKDNTNTYVRLVRGGTSSNQNRWASTLDPQAILDKTTNLVWRRCGAGLSWDGSTCVGSALFLTHEQSIQYARDLPGWRLPNVNELGSIIDRSHDKPNYFFEGFTSPFPGFPEVWTASPFVSDAQQAWIGYFWYGGIGPRTRADKLNVWLVKDSN